MDNKKFDEQDEKFRKANITNDMILELATNLVKIGDDVCFDILDLTSILNMQKNDYYYIPKAFYEAWRTEKEHYQDFLTLSTSKNRIKEILGSTMFGKYERYFHTLYFRRCALDPDECREFFNNKPKDSHLNKFIVNNKQNLKDILNIITTMNLSIDY